ncbi:MAG: hypothetical protein WAT71_14510 [Ignavibacteria bacterium]
MKIKFSIFAALLVISALSLFLINPQETVSNSNVNELSVLPEGTVTVHYEFGTGLVPEADVYIKLNGTGSNLFGTPITTNSSGYIFFRNGGSSFPNGSYEVRAKKFGFGDGVTTLNIVNNVPVYPNVSVNLGTPE